MANTPRYWGDYLKYIQDFNRKNKYAMKCAVKEYEREFATKPWYVKLLADPVLQVETIKWSYESRVKEPSLLGYYNWDVQIRRVRK